MAYLDDFPFPTREIRRNWTLTRVITTAGFAQGTEPQIRLVSSSALRKQVGQPFQAFPSSHHTILILSDLVNFRDVLWV